MSYLMKIQNCTPGRNEQWQWCWTSPKALNKIQKPGGRSCSEGLLAWNLFHSIGILCTKYFWHCVLLRSKIPNLSHRNCVAHFLHCKKQVVQQLVSNLWNSNKKIFPLGKTFPLFCVNFTTLKGDCKWISKSKEIEIHCSKSIFQEMNYLW